MKIWAIIPARQGSKSLPNKNILKLKGIPLIAHSIKFAEKLSFIDRIIVSTDSQEYANIAIEYGAEVPFLRGKKASNDDSMEEDVLLDIKKKCLNEGMDLPDAILWLRPTHPLRSIDHFEQMNDLFQSGNYDSVIAVVETDSRIFLSQNNSLKHVIDDEYFTKHSMTRRQDSVKAFKMFYGELFGFPETYNSAFLGDKIGFVTLPESCKKRR